MKIKFIIPVVGLALICSSCGLSSSSIKSVASTSETKLYDTSGNEITSGNANVSFVYGRQTTTKTIQAKYLIDGVNVTIEEGDFESSSSSENEVVFLVINGGSLTIEGTSTNYVNIVKTGSEASSGQVDDDYNFYGINSGIVVSGSTSKANIKYANIVTSSNGSNAVVATNESEITIANSVIVTSGSSGSRGLHTTYGGNINASGTSIVTKGVSCATLANDRGGGTITATNMTLETNSNGSPLVYSTDSISVSSSTGVSNNAQMVVVEGESSVTLEDCSFSCTGKGNRTGTSEINTSSHTIDEGGIFIYQSFSGDSSVGVDYFKATNCTFNVTSEDVPMFYLTNITADISLIGNTFTQASSSDYLLVAESTDQWGNSSSNGATVSLSLSNQDWDENRTFCGAISSITYK